jgi:hypothetical protein
MDPTLHRPRDASQYRAPQVITRRTLPNGRLASTFLAEDAAYTSELMSIGGPSEDADFLRMVAALISSSYGNYWQFMTSASWGVERGTVEMNELLDMPIPCATLDELDPALLRRIRELTEPQSTYSPGLLADLDQVIYDLFDLSAADRARIANGITQKLAWFQGGSRYNPTALEADVDNYVATVANSLRRSMADVNIHTGYGRKDNYITVWLSFTDERTGSKASAPTSGRRVLDTDEILQAGGNVSAGTTGLVSLPAAFLVDEDTVYLVKTADRDRWSHDAALNDAARVLTALAFGV